MRARLLNAAGDGVLENMRACFMASRNKQGLNIVLAAAAAREMEQSNPDSRSTSQPFLLKHSDRTPSRQIPRNRSTKATTRDQETRRQGQQIELLA